MTSKPTKQILVVLTGGTICSSPDPERDNKNDIRAQQSKRRIIEGFFDSDSPFCHEVTFDEVALSPAILSENMTVDTWNALLDIFRRDGIFQDYAGVIVLHGTDTLAYTASLLSLVLAGAPIPVCLVAAQLSLTDPRTNGHENFRAAVELILNGIAPNVYAVYRNDKNAAHEKGEFLVHYGSHLKPCENYSNNFHSLDEMTIPDPSNACLAGKPFQTTLFYIKRPNLRLSPDVLLITPHVGLSYSRLSLDGVKAVVHSTYHSDTVCVERATPDAPYSDASILSLLDRCRALGVPLFLAPCDSKAYAYVSTGDALENDARAISHTTLEMAYVKTLLGCALGLQGDELEAFLANSINDEFVYWTPNPYAQ